MPTQDFKGTINGVLPNQIIGDGIAGRVLRSSVLYISDGTSATHIKVGPSSLWNGAISGGTQDDIGPDGVTTGVWSLNIADNVLSLLAAGMAGTLLSVLLADVTYNLSGTALTVEAYESGGKMDFSFKNSVGGAVALTTLVDTGALKVQVLYLTSS